MYAFFLLPLHTNYLHDMAKKKNIAKQGGMDVGFKVFRNNLPDEIQNMLDSLGVSSFEDLEGLAVMMGIDMDKLSKFSQEHGMDKNPTMEDVAFDDDHPLAGISRNFSHFFQEGDDDDAYDAYDDALDPFEFPEKPVIEGEKACEFHLRIKLNNAPVPVWREIKVPSNISIEFFSWVICSAMGWYNEHLHQFRLKDKVYKNKACIREDQKYAPLGYSRIRTLATEDYPISELFKEEKVRIKYEYDFGDSWEHDIWLKGVRDYEDGESPKLLCHKGVGACPPEDCGGVWGYADLLYIFEKKRKTAEEKERLRWYDIGKNFDPNEFYPEDVQPYLDDLWESVIEDV